MPHSEKLQNIFNIFTLPWKVVLIFNLGISKFCTRFPKLIVVPVYEMRWEIVRYDHLTSFKTLAHTFPRFLPFQLSAWSSQGFSKFAIASFSTFFKKNCGHNYAICWLPSLEICERLLICTHLRLYIQQRYLLSTAK